MFEASVYAARRAELARILASRGAGEGAVLLLGHRESPINYPNNCYAFRQDSSFLYFVGLSAPGLAAAIDLGSGEARLYGDDATLDDIVWTGPQTSVAELAARSGIRVARPRSALAADLAASRRPAAGAAATGTVRYFPTYRAEVRAEIAEIVGLPYAEVDAGASADLVAATVGLREVKEGREVDELERAVAVSVDMHRAALSTARAGMLEADVYARVMQVALASGGDSSFLPIATVDGARLHATSRGRRLEAGSLFLLDAGAETAMGYAGDLTTTFPIAPRFDDRQRAIYELVLRMQRAASAILKPGLPYLDAHLAAAREGVVGLTELGIMRGDPDESLASGAYALFFPHGLGHLLGLDVHDMESYGEDAVGYAGEKRSELFGLKSLRLAKPLRAGMALTVEPGIYFIPELHERWSAEKRYANYIDYAAARGWLGLGGVRVEEDWLVTESGARMLGPAFDRSVAAVEAARS